MSIFRVLQKNIDSAEIVDNDSVLIKEAFSWFAFLLPPIWAMANNLWVELVLMIVAIIALVLASSFVGSEAGFWLYILGSFWLAYEAAAIKTKALKRKGFVENGSLIASDEEQAFVSWVNFSLKDLIK